MQLDLFADAGQQDSPPVAGELVPAGQLLLSPDTLDALRRSRTDETRRAYAHSIADWRDWCRRQHLVEATGDEDTAAAMMAEYTTWCIQRGWKPNYIARHWAAIRGWFAAQGYPRPGLGLARDVLRAYQRDLAASKWKPRQAPVYDLADVRAMAALCAGADMRSLRDRTVLLVSLAAYARRSEPAHLDIDDVTFVPEGMIIDFRRTKTGPKEKVFPYGAHLNTCVVRTVAAYIDALASYGVTDGPLLRSVNCAGRPNRKRLTPHSVQAIQRALAVEAGVRNAAKVTGHSARASGATISYEAGRPIHAIADHGGWKPGSASLSKYLRLRDRWQQSPIAGIGL